MSLLVSIVLHFTPYSFELLQFVNGATIFGLIWKEKEEERIALLPTQTSVLVLDNNYLAITDTWNIYTHVMIKR